MKRSGLAYGYSTFMMALAVVFAMLGDKQEDAWESAGICWNTRQR